jgi:hypothetical protein
MLISLLVDVFATAYVTVIHFDWLTRTADLTWEAAKRTAKDRRKWRTTVEVLKKMFHKDLGGFKVKYD